MVLITIFVIVVLAGVAKLVYDTQKKKKQTPTKTEDDFEFKDDFQKLAGIKPIEGLVGSELPTNLTTKMLNEQIVEALLKAAENSEFPKSDESINVQTTKITTIDTNFGDNDPLATIPMSRVSKEGKKKMAEIAKDDINTQIEKNAEKFEALNVGLKACGCGRSETGFCTGLHMIPKKDWANGVREIPAPKKKANPKQMNGTKSDASFVKTKRKYTKKPKA
jgi:CDGSH-type Zn-finger protein